MAVGEYALATLSNINEYLGYTIGDDTTRDTLLEHLLDRASTAIETYCDRKFKSRNYRLERYNGDGSELLFLNQKPIISIARISIGSKTALTLECEDSSAVHASVDIDTTSVAIYQIAGTDAGTSTYTYSTYGTISAMGAVIGALTNWSAEVATGTGSHLSSDLLDVYGAYCLDDSLDLRIPDTAIQDFTVYKEGGKQMGIIHRNAGWSSGNMNVIVTYTAGYSTVPNDILQACVQLATAIYNTSKRDMTLKSETLGDYSYTVANADGNSMKSLINMSGAAELLGSYKNLWVV